MNNDSMEFDWEDVDSNTQTEMNKEYEIFKSGNNIGWSSFKQKNDKVNISQIQKKVDLYKYLVVVDTNIMLYKQKFLSELVQLPIEHRVAIVVPWVVVQELDGLKNSDKYCKEKFESLSNLARSAMNFLLKYLLNENANLIGQNFNEILNINNPMLAKNDDKILDCCFYFKEKFSKEVILLTNDKALCVKAIFSHIQVHENWSKTAMEFITHIKSENEHGMIKSTSASNLNIVNDNRINSMKNINSIIKTATTTTTNTTTTNIKMNSTTTTKTTSAPVTPTRNNIINENGEQNIYATAYDDHKQLVLDYRKNNNTSYTPELLSSATNSPDLIQNNNNKKRKSESQTLDLLKSVAVDPKIANRKILIPKSRIAHAKIVKREISNVPIKSELITQNNASKSKHELESHKDHEDSENPRKRMKPGNPKSQSKESVMDVDLKKSSKSIYEQSVDEFIQVIETYLPNGMQLYIAKSIKKNKPVPNGISSVNVPMSVLCIIDYLIQYWDFFKPGYPSFYDDEPLEKAKILKAILQSYLKNSCEVKLKLDDLLTMFSDISQILELCEGLEGREISIQRRRKLKAIKENFIKN